MNEIEELLEEIMKSGEMIEQDLVGKRVQHACEDPDCPLKGRVIRVDYFPNRTVDGEQSDWWALVKWEVPISCCRSFFYLPGEEHKKNLCQMAIHGVKVMEEELVKK